MKRLGSLVAISLLAGAYSASACSSDEEPSPPGAGGSAGSAGSSNSGTGGGIDDCLPRACCRDGVVTTTYGACEKLMTTCALGCRPDLPQMGCVTTNALGGVEEATTFAQSVCIDDGSAGKGGTAGAGGTSGAGSGGLGGAGGQGGEGGEGGEGGATDGGMGGEGGR